MAAVGVRLVATADQPPQMRSLKKENAVMASAWSILCSYRWDYVSGHGAGNSVGGITATTATKQYVDTKTADAGMIPVVPPVLGADNVQDALEIIAQISISRPASRHEHLSGPPGGGKACPRFARSGWRAASFVLGSNSINRYDQGVLSIFCSLYATG
jgi:hypothetical protein